MTSQATVLRSPCGRYAAAQVHQFIALVDSTGSLVDLPAPVFTLSEDAPESDDEAAGEGEDAEEGEGAADAAAEQPKKKKVKHAQDKPGAASTSQKEHSGPKPIRVIAFHPNREWMMYQSEDKYIHLYHMHASYASGFKHIETVSVPKKVQAAVFHATASSPSTTHFRPDDAAVALQLPHLLVADKTGDVFSVGGANLATQKTELGHLAGVTGLDFFTQAPAAAGGKAKNFCLSSDSDGKIRVSNSPNYFDIQAFCLGHAAFVSAFAVVPAQPQPAIVSGGVGSEVILWQLHDGKQVMRLDLAAHKPKSAEAAASSSSAVAAAASANATPAEAAPATAPAAETIDCYISQVSYVPSAAGSSTHTVLVSVYPWECVFLLELDAAAQSIAVRSVVNLPTATMHAHVSADELLFIDASLRVRAWSLGSSSELGAEGDSLLAKTLSAFNGAFSAAQADAAALLITASNADAFVGAGTDAPKYAPTTEAGKARAAAAAAAGHTGRYISPFSSLHADHLVRLSLLSPHGFTFRRYADKMHREAYVQGKRLESNARREASKAAKIQKTKDNQRKKREDKEKEQEAMEE